MKTMLKISDAVSLAFHAVVLMASNSDRQLSNREISKVLCVSEAHLSKVLQRLTKTGLVKSIRGPKGGFILGKKSDKISLLAIYEAIEGRLVLSHCLLGTRVCKKNKCIFGELLKKVDRQVYNYLSGTTISDTKLIYNNSDENSSKDTG